MLEVLQRLVEVESPSSDLEALARCAGVVDSMVREILGSAPERIETQGRTHLLWRGGGSSRVGLIGHFDTVWPIGTLAERPFTVEDGIARGPGIFDMKCGIVQALFAVAALDNRDGVELLLTSDEEIGSPTAEAAITEMAHRVSAVLVLEASHNGALKIARKGHASYTVRVTGRSSHAGLEPEKGVNALGQLARTVLEVEAIAAPGAGTTVTPTVAHAGTTTNVIPAEGTLSVDSRAWSIEEQQRVASAMGELRPSIDGAGLEIIAGPTKPPLEKRMSEDLFKRARRIAETLGLPELEGVEVGGGSDGNLTAALGTPTLDGLGAVGGGAHAVDEHIVIGEMAPRTELVTRLIEDLLA